MTKHTQTRVTVNPALDVKSSATLLSPPVTASLVSDAQQQPEGKEVIDEELYGCDALDVLWLMDGTWCWVTLGSSWPSTTKVSNTQPCLWDRWSMSGRRASTWARLGRCRPSHSGWLWPEKPQPSPGPGTRAGGRRTSEFCWQKLIFKGSTQRQVSTLCGLFTASNKISQSQFTADLIFSEPEGLYKRHRHGVGSITFFHKLPHCSAKVWLVIVVSVTVTYLNSLLVWQEWFSGLQAYHELFVTSQILWINSMTASFLSGSPENLRKKNINNMYRAI